VHKWYEGAQMVVGKVRDFETLDAQIGLHQGSLLGVLLFLTVLEGPAIARWLRQLTCTEETWVQLPLAPI